MENKELETLATNITSALEKLINNFDKRLKLLENNTEIPREYEEKHCEVEKQKEDIDISSPDLHTDKSSKYKYMDSHMLCTYLGITNAQLHYWIKKKRLTPRGLHNGRYIFELKEVERVRKNYGSGFRHKKVYDNNIPKNSAAFKRYKNIKPLNNDIHVDDIITSINDIKNHE